jgi:hypothetical protein
MDRRAASLLFLAALAAAGCGGSSTVATPAAAPPPTAQAPAAEPDAAPRRPSGAPREISFDDIKLEMEKGAPFTRDLLPIRIRGYILPSFQQTGLTQFVLVRDNQECCFGPGAALHDCVVVRMRPGKTADFSIRPVAVAGTFKIDELRAPDGSHLAIYALDGDEVK